MTIEGQRLPGLFVSQDTRTWRDVASPGLRDDVKVMMSEPDTWIEDWLSAPRFAVYLVDAASDRGLALARYQWNADVAAAFHHDLGHLEVGLRNAYDRALSYRDRSEDQHWVYDPSRHFPVQRRQGRGGSTYDANATTRRKIAEAISAASDAAGSQHPAPGKVIAELNLGFWRYLTVRRLDQLWRTHLYRAFPRGTRRGDIGDLVDGLHSLRNRVAHHEPLLRIRLADRHADILTLAGLLSVPLRDHIANHTAVSELLATRP
ncbi:hypothetical protein [Pseudonocardia xishanensis]|uniref:Abi family protein n=1 Tax=Pseudonocardia xishanensis TaxID=630995 RepID=A0ABP8RC62_9PSEU